MYRRVGGITKKKVKPTNISQIVKFYLNTHNITVMIWKEFSRVPDFFFIFIKHGYYFSGSWTQVSIVVNSELHWF